MRGLRGFHPDEALRGVIEEVRGLASRTHSAQLERLIMGLRTDVQALIDKVAENSSVVQSAEAAMQVLEDKIADLQHQVAAIQPGQTLSDEDVSALQKASSDLGEINAGLRAAIPANTSGTPGNPAPASPDTPPSTPPSA